MILLGFGAEMLTRLMRSDPRGPGTEWLLAGPTELAVETPDSTLRESWAEDWPLAAE